MICLQHHIIISIVIQKQRFKLIKNNFNHITITTTYSEHPQLRFHLKTHTHITVQLIHYRNMKTSNSNKYQLEWEKITMFNGMGI